MMPTSIQLDQTSLNLTPGSAVKLTATVLPDSVPDKSVTWSSDAPTIAEVLSDGTVTEKSAGIAIITAKTTNGLTITCAVTVALKAQKGGRPENRFSTFLKEDSRREQESLSALRGMIDRKDSDAENNQDGSGNTV